MFAQPQLRLIFLSLFTFSVSFSMEKPEAYVASGSSSDEDEVYPQQNNSMRSFHGNSKNESKRPTKKNPIYSTDSDDSSEDYPIKFTKKSPFNSKPYKSRKNFRNEKTPIYGEQPYQPKGRYSNPNEINSNYKQFIETAPEDVTLKILCLKDPEIAFENSYCKKLLLHGLPGNGKTSLAKAIGLETYGKYYYIDASSLLTKWKNCHEDLKSEIQPLIDKGEPIVIIWDEINCITDQYKNNNSSDGNMPAALWSLLDYCEEEAPFLFMIGTTNNHPDDFPEQLTSRFDEDDRVFIPCPDLPIRRQIMTDRFKNKQSNLTDDDENVLLEQLEGRSCRNIVKVLDKAIAYSVRTNKVITRELVDLAIEKNPLKPSKYQRLAQILNTTEAEVQEAIANKVLLEKNRETVDFIIKKKGIALQQASLDQSASQYQGNLDKQVENIVLQTRLNLMTKSRDRSVQVNGSVTFGANGGANIGGSVTHSVVTNGDYEAMKNILPDKEAAAWDAQDAEAQARVTAQAQAQQNQPAQQNQQEERAKVNDLMRISTYTCIGMVLGGALGGPLGIGVVCGLGYLTASPLLEELKDSPLLKEMEEEAEEKLKNCDFSDF